MVVWMIISRRKILSGLIAAPAIIAIDRLMPLSFEKKKLIVPIKIALRREYVWYISTPVQS